METFKEEFCGSYAKIAIDWLDWLFKNKDNSSLFLENELADYPG